MKRLPLILLGASVLAVVFILLAYLTARGLR